MSIIQDALKRKAEEQPPPPTPPPIDPPSSTPAGTVSTGTAPHTIVILLTVLILLVVIAAALAATLFFLWNQTAQRAPDPAPVEQHEPADYEADVPPEGIPVPPAEPAEETPVPPVETPSPPEPDLAPPEPTPSVDPSVEKRLADPPPAVEEVEWPDLRVSAIAASGGRRLAWINGQLLSEGRTIAGVRIVEIREREVLFSLQGETRIIYLTE